ncbi:MAG: hypothetical protein LCH46_01630 [Proteobacteria bacterium]|nr:hypothetical protein [Pseudomonadota bacterium]
MRRIDAISAAALLGLSLALGGCSYRPLYATPENGVGVTAQLSQVSVAEQKSRAGQLVRNELMSGFNGGTDGSLLLKMAPAEKTQGVSSLAFEKTERHRYRLTIAYELVDVRTGEALTKGTSFSNVPYDTVEEPVADLRAAESARERAAREVAQDLRLRLASFLSTRNS